MEKSRRKNKELKKYLSKANAHYDLLFVATHNHLLNLNNEAADNGNNEAMMITN
jgi:hypothetical protein